MSVPLPSQDSVCQAILSLIHTDLTRSDGLSRLQPVLAAAGATVDLSPAEEDSGSYLGLRYGELLAPPDGVSIFVIPETDERQWALAPGIKRASYGIRIKIVSRDYPNNHLLRAPRKQRQFLTSMNSAMVELLGPDGLPALGGSWLVLSGGTLLIHEPAYALTLIDSDEMQGRRTWFTEVNFQGVTYY